MMKIIKFIVNLIKLTDSNYSLAFPVHSEYPELCNQQQEYRFRDTGGNNGRACDGNTVFHSELKEASF